MIRWRLPVILICITLSVKLLFADQEGFSDIQLHDGSGGTEINLHMGEETEIYVHLNSHGELLTGFQLMLTLQAGVLEIIPGEDGLPFQQLGEGYFAPCGGAIVLTNNLHGDPDNGLPGTQLDYIIQTGQGESPRPSCANNTDILSFRVRALSEFSGWPLTIDQDNLIFRNTLYWQAGSNATWDFNLEQTPQFTIAGFAFFPPLPDLQLTTTAPRDTINLYDYLEAFFSPDSEFVIGYQVIAGAAAALVDTVRIDGQEFLFIFARQPVEPALMEVVITATALDTVNACDTMLVLCDDPPIVNEPLPNLLLVEDSSDSTLWLDEWISDNDHADSWLTYAVLEQSFVQLSIDPVTHRATVTPPQDWYGVDTLGFVVTDPLGQADSAAIAVEVLAVNDAPQLAAQLQFPLYPGSELVLSLSDLVYDPDNSWQELDWSLAGGQDSISTILDTVEGTLRCFTTALSLIDSSFSYLL
ncbi:MAG: hypothetical protein ISR91_06460, partial [Candidatus Delongbacteria bacterium]|nr:hypothetical protein [Candidatus Delongbacteria bacterium]